MNLKLPIPYTEQLRLYQTNLYFFFILYVVQTSSLFLFILRISDEVFKYSIYTLSEK